MKTTLFSFITLLIFTSCNFTSQAQEPFDQKVKAVMEENNIPSMSIGVIKNGEITMLKGFGTKSRNDSTQVNENSIYQIASQSKMFTAIIVKNLIEEGKLNLNEPLTTYFTDAIKEENKKRLEKIKLIHILNHTAGFSRDGLSIYKNRVEGESWRNGYSRTELVEDINNTELDSEPGSKFQYSNAGYAIVGLICENVSGLTYDQLLRKYVTDLYELKNTVVHLNGLQQELLVTSYKKRERETVTRPYIMGMATPASALYSSASDLTKMMQNQMNAYRAYQEKETSSSLLLTNQTAEMGSRGGMDMEYGFGLIEVTKGKDIIYTHGGDIDGFACEYFFNPTKNNGVVILTSSGGRWIPELAIEIMESLK